MTFGSLFSGIGGLDLGLEKAGMECRWQVENNPYCQSILKRHWPEVPRYGDIAELQSLEKVDLICGGFPCQPVSLAGLRKGEEDERWLWPEFARIIRMVGPEVVLVENVPGLLVRGMGEVLGDLAGLGYDARWQVLSAASLGAPHLRKRVFIVGWDPLRRRNGSGDWEVRTLQGRAAPNTKRDSEVPNSHSRGLQSLGSSRVLHGERETPRDHPDRCRCQAEGCHWAVEPDVGRVAHGVPKRVDRLRALGNAVVPQCAEAIGRMIMEKT